MKRIILKSNVNGTIELFTTFPELFVVHPKLEKISLPTYLEKKEKYEKALNKLKRKIKELMK